MKTIGSYAIEVTTLRDFDEAIARVTALLREEGFGVLTEIDVRDTLRNRLGIETRPYRILGACNPPLAHRALEHEPHVGVLLPCNVVIWDEGDHRVVTAMEPRVMAAIVDGDAIRAVAEEASQRLRRVLERID